jgi:nicotinic acid mononucleotide adenylyltransferase
MKVLCVTQLTEKFEECDITTHNENFFVKANDCWVLIHNSPALIFGWRGDEFILTDKAGFGAKGYDGLTTNSAAIEQMIMNRKIKDTSPQAMAKRQAYAGTIAKLHPILKAAVPKSFKGYAQGDLLYVGTPNLVNGQYVFKPNKIEYKVGETTDLGKMIGKSKVGMVVHSVYDSPQDEEPAALRDVHSLGWKSQGDLVVVPHEIELIQPLQLNPKLFAQAKSVLTSHADQINKLFDPLSLTDRSIKALPGLMKAFLAYKAGEGDNDFSRVAQEFINWLTSSSSKASAKMQTSVGEWIRENIDGYNAVWEFVKLIVDVKLDLKAQMDQQVGTIVSAELENKPGHEGFVSVTPDGIIKLVHRAEFMKKDKPLSEDVNTLPKRVVFTYARMNPPTLGHRMLVDKMKAEAGADDYWVFLSHNNEKTKDPKRDPLTWEQKVQFVKQIMKPHAAHVISDPSVKLLYQTFKWLYNQGYRELNMVVGSDRVPAMTTSLQNWNSEKERIRDGRDPVIVKVISAGERDPDSDDTTPVADKPDPTQVKMSAISGTKARKAVEDGDLPAFEKFTGLKGTVASKLFKAVQVGMNTPKENTSRRVSEGIFSKIRDHFIGSKDDSVSIKEPSRFPPHSYRDIEPVVAWVRQKVAYEIHKGRDPVKTLFDSNYHAGDIWLDIHAGLSKEMSDKVKAHLRKDPLIGAMMRGAPAYDPNNSLKDLHHPSSSGSGYSSTTSDGGMNTFTQNYINQSLSEGEHDNGTIAKLDMNLSVAQKLHDWCVQHDIDCIEPYDLHCTVMFSKKPAPELASTPCDLPIQASIVGWKILGTNVLTLELECDAMHELHAELSEAGGRHEYADFIPHTSVVYGWPHKWVPEEVPDMNLVFNAFRVEGIDPKFAESRK